MRHGLNNTVVEIKRSLNKILAIASDSGSAESYRGVLISYQLHECTKSLLNLSQWVSIIVGVALEKDTAFRVGDNELSGGRARVNAKECVNMLSLGQFGIHERLNLESALPLIVLSFVLKEG